MGVNPPKKVRFDMTGRLDGVRRTPQGFLLASANLTRVGVFTYFNADGSKTLELRHPDEIFKSDALESLKMAPLTIGHPGMVTPENVRDLQVGVTGTDVRADGKFVKATVLVQDADAIRRVELGASDPKNPDALLELSCGYECEVEKADGEFDGEAFNARQVGHKYNHVALGPANWGRAGSDVRLTLDEAGNVRGDSYAADMSLKTDDTKDLTARLDAVTGERDGLKSKLDAANAEIEKLKADLVGANALTSKLIDPSKIDGLVSARVDLESRARAVLGGEFKPEVSEKVDGKDVTRRMTDREVMLAVLAKTAPKFDAKDRSEEYVRARFDAETEIATKADQAIEGANAASSPSAQTDATKGAGQSSTKSRLDEANEKAAELAKKQAQGGAPEGSVTRKA